MQQRYPSAFLDDDTPEFRAAVRFLLNEGVKFRRPTRYQLKVGRISFYPGTGTIQVDEELGPRPEKGLAAFKELVRQTVPKPRSATTNQRAKQDAVSSSGGAAFEHVEVHEQVYVRCEFVELPELDSVEDATGCDNRNADD